MLFKKKNTGSSTANRTKFLPKNERATTNQQIVFSQKKNDVNPVARREGPRWLVG
jgi:hypothetical protein